MRVVSFYTNDFYKAQAAEMAASAVAVGLEVWIYKRPDGGSWSANLLHKADVILEAMAATSEDILYVDADCRFLAYPNLLAEPGDWDVAWGWLRPNHPHGCVLHFRRTQRAVEYVTWWASMPARYPHVRLDEIHMQYAFREMKDKGLRHKTLPPAYAWMKHMRRIFAGARPVICHIGAGAGSDKVETIREADELL